jgi:hypothetical protein
MSVKVRNPHRISYMNHMYFNPLNATLNPICHLLALLGAHHILHISRIRVKEHYSCGWRRSIALSLFLYKMYEFRW